MNPPICHPDDGAASAHSKTRRRSQTGAAVLGIAAAVLLTGCSSSSKAPVSTTTPPAASSTVSAAPGTSSSSSQPAAEPVVITIDKFAYSTPATVSPGAKITVTNKDGENHTVTEDKDGGFDLKVDGDGSATFTAPTEPGSYPFHCIYHSNMHGVLVVK